MAEAVTGELHIGAVALEGEVASVTVPARRYDPGVTTLTTTLPGEALPVGGVGITARLVSGGVVLDEATPRPLAIRPRPPAGRTSPRVWVVGGDSEGLAYLRRRHLPAVTSPSDPFDVALVVHPERMTTSVPLDERLAVWHHVRQGGEALVLLEDPTASHRQRILGSRRGVQTLAALPVPVLLRGAGGHWMGVFHLVNSAAGGDTWWSRTDDEIDGVIRMLGRGDEVVAPVAMVDGSLPAGGAATMMTLGHMGRRLGFPVVTYPYGAGRLHLVGVPLLKSVDGKPDSRRDALLDTLLTAVADAGRIEPWTPLPPALAARVQTALLRLSRLAGAGDRFSPFTGTSLHNSSLPEAAAVALAAKNAALARLLDGDVTTGALELERLADRLWSADWEAWLDREDEVLTGLEALVTGPTGAGDLMRAQPVAEGWAQAIRLQFGGDTAGALERLDRAKERLNNDP
jgi:hypothetical protein